MREKLIRTASGQDAVAYEFSFDNGYGRAPQFFRVPQVDMAQARALYTEWGGSRDEGFRVGTTARGPGIAPVPYSYAWSEPGAKQVKKNRF